MESRLINPNEPCENCGQPKRDHGSRFGEVVCSSVPPATKLVNLIAEAPTPDVFTKAFVTRDDLQHPLVMEWATGDQYVVVVNDAMRPGRALLGGVGYVGLVDLETREVMWSRT